MVELLTLSTERLLLRPPETADVRFVYERACDPEFGRFLPLPEPYTMADAERFVAGMMARDWDEHPSFVITRHGRPVGDVSVRVDMVNAAAEMGWGMAREHWGKGYMSEAARATMAWAFAAFELGKVGARCDADNVASWRVMEKLGMHREGHLRRQRLLRGERRDELIYGITREELEAGGRGDAPWAPPSLAV